MKTPRPSVCPRCGGVLPADAPKGLCPRCLAAMNLATETAFTGADAVAAQPPLTPDELAPHFPQLEILECLGRGGMGVVYKARQKSLHRLVALKLLAPERVQDPEFAARFAREAQALAALSHTNIVTVHDFGQAAGFYFLLMEFLDGVNLRQLLRSRKLTPEEALAIVPPLCDALQYAHDRGIVHRDIKPENLLLDKEGHIKIADFGIARMLGGDAPDGSTGDDRAVGTPGYMAPEQKRAPQLVDSRADIYSLGVVFYEMLTGELPAGKLQLPSRKVRIDVRLDEIVLRALEKEPEMRFQTASDFGAEVETIATSGSKPAPSGAEAIPLAATNEPSRRWRFGKMALVALSSIIGLPLVVLLGYLVLRSHLDRQQFNELLRLRGEVDRARLLEREAEQLQRDQVQIARAKLPHAREKLMQIRKLHPERIVSDAELDQAEFEVKLLAARAEGDEAGVLQIRLEQAERELARATDLYKQSLISQMEYDEARHKAELARSGVKENATRTPGSTTHHSFDTKTVSVGQTDRSIATNSGPLLVVDLWNALRPMGNPMQVRFQGAPVDPAMLPEAERRASRPLLVPSAEGTPWKIAWSVKPLANLGSVGFLLPDTTSARQAAEQVNKLVNGHELRFRGDVEFVLFDLLKTSGGPYRAWVEFASREGTAAAPGESVPSGIGVALARQGNRIVVGRIVPNSPAAISGGIKEGDVILAVGQADEAPVAVTGLEISKVVSMIRGPVGVPVFITVVTPEKALSDRRTGLSVERDTKGDTTVSAFINTNAARTFRVIRGELDMLRAWGDGHWLATGEVAPQFLLTLLPAREERLLSDYRGRIVVLEFWATWCGPCQQTMSELQPFMTDLMGIYSERPHWKGKVAIITASVDENPHVASRHVKAKRWVETTPSWSDAAANAWVEASVMRAYHVNALPTMYIIDRDGKVAAVGHHLAVGRIVNDLLSRNAPQNVPASRR